MPAARIHCQRLMQARPSRARRCAAACGGSRHSGFPFQPSLHLKRTEHDYGWLKIQSAAARIESTLTRRLRRRVFFPIAVVDPDRRAPGVRSGVDVAPAVANHEAMRHVDIVFLRRAQQQTWSRLPAVASIGIIVRADEEVIQRKSFPQCLMDRVHRSRGLCVPRAMSG